MNRKILIYGAGGYMGRLFTQYANQEKFSIVLGSRDSIATNEELRVFSLEDTSVIKQHLKDIKLVVNLAGPFALTQQPLIEACLQTGSHYIDISGEVPEFESAFRFDEQAKQAHIMLMPGAGFGVVPSDIAAKLAYQKLPDAQRLILAYLTVGGASRGTLKTVLKDIHKQGIEIVHGKVIKAMPAKSDFNFEADGRNHRVVYNPWRGDLFTARHSTNIPNIQTYSNFPGFVERMMKGKLLWLRDFILKRLINILPVGPSEKDLQKGKTIIYAEVKNAKNETATVRIKGPEAYVFTAQTLTNISLKIMNGNISSGFQTPAIYGSEIILSNFNNVEIN